MRKLLIIAALLPVVACADWVVRVNPAVASVASVAESNAWYTGKYASNPVMTTNYPAQEDAVYEPTVLYANNQWMMYFSSGTVSSSCWLATSPDTTNWTLPFNHPIVGSGYGGVTSSPPVASRNSVFLHTNGVFYMYTAEGTGGGPLKGIQLHTSTDGTNFTKYGNIMNPALSGWDDDLASADVWVETSPSGVETWKMIFDSLDTAVNTWQLGLAWAPAATGVWQKSASNPLASLRIGSGNAMYGHPSIHKIGEKYHMWLHCSKDSNIAQSFVYHAYSYDLTNWTYTTGVNAPVLGPTAAWEGSGNADQQLADVCVVERNGRTYMFYDHSDNNYLGTGRYHARIGASVYEGTVTQLVDTATNFYCQVVNVTTNVINKVPTGYAATGGDYTNDYTLSSVNYRAHTFTNSGTLVVAAGVAVDVLMVAGGGGGGFNLAAGGGGGGVIATSLTASAQSYSIVVGLGGAGGTSGLGTTGQASTAFGLVAVGGGGGGGNLAQNGGSGGSGGGGAGTGYAGGSSSAAGQGYAGGNGSTLSSGGGGGWASVGTNANNRTGGQGGAGGVSVLRDGTTAYYAGGGGGGTYTEADCFVGAGGIGGGGAGGKTTAGVSGGVSTGGGGGGGSNVGGAQAGGNGGSGIVIVRYVVN
jgi:hypothetical protein